MATIYMNRPGAAKMITNAWLKAVTRAMNKTMQKARVGASKKVREVYNIKASDLKRSLKMFNANKNKLIAGFYVSSKQGLKLLYFNAIDQNPRGVRFKIKKASGMKRLPEAFIAKMPSGHINVFMRKGKGRLPLKSLYSIDPVGMYNQVATQEVGDIIERQYFELFNKQLEYEMSKI